MATIVPTPVNGNFNSVLFQFLKTDGIEGFKPFVYSDSKKIPTLGVGYALVTNNGGTWSVRPGYQTDLANAGINLTTTQVATLNSDLTAAANALNGQRGSSTPFNPLTNVLNWSMTETQAQSLFDNIISTYKTVVQKWLGNDTIFNSLQGSQEMLVLESLAYNGYMGHGKSPKLRAAILNGDQAEAWYEIRDDTGGSQLRDYAEAALFGLYPQNQGQPNISPANALQIYQMYTLQASNMQTFDQSNSTALNQAGILSRANPQLGNIANAYNVPTTLAPVETALISYLGSTYSILSGLNSSNYSDTNILVSPQRSTVFSGSANNPQWVPLATSYSANLHPITSTGNSILIGGIGNDVLSGVGSGNDILIAGTGNDKLTAGSGADTLIGGAGNDALIGQSGSNDTFVYSGIAKTAELDNVIANGAKGTIYVGNTQLTGPGGQATFKTINVDNVQNMVWTASDGTQYQFAPNASFSVFGTLTISNGSLNNGTSGSNGGEIVIQNFNIGAAQSSTGYLGLNFTPQVAIETGSSSDPFTTAGATITSAACTASGVSQAFSIFCSAVCDVAQKITVTLAGGVNLICNDGANTFPVSGSFTLTIPAGQDSVTFGLIDPTTSPQPATVGVSTTLDGSSTPSNTETVTFNGTTPSGASTIITGQSIVNGTSYTLDTGNDVVNISNTGSGYDLVIASDFNPSGGVIYSADNGNSTINGGGAQDVILAGNGNNQIYANTTISLSTALTQAKSATATNAQGNYIGVGNGNNTIVGSNGNDFINVGTGGDVIVCGAGNNLFAGGVSSTGAASDWSYQFSGGTTFEGLPNIVTGFTPINCNLQSTVIWNAPPPPAGFDGDYYNEGGTLVPAGLGNDTIYGGTGNSEYALSNGNNYLDAGGGNDQIEGGSGNNTIFGGSGNDSIGGGGGNNYIDAESGNDLIANQGGSSTIFGGTGNDTIYSGDYGSTWATSQTATNSYLDAGSGTTILYGAGGNDTLMGGSGNDSLFAGAGNEYLEAGSGNTSLEGGAGNETLIGGSGNDTIFAGGGNDSIQGGSGNASITGGAGNDIIVCGSGNDAINAGSGNTTITGGSGWDRIWGGAGTNVITTGDGGTDAAFTQVIAGTGNTTVTGGAGVDHIQGGAGTNVLSAGDGGDAGLATQVIAGSGATTITGGAGVDALFAGSGTDLITAGSGATTIMGGSGTDTMVAGSGTDQFFGGTGKSTYQINSGSGNVSIYNAAAGDVLQFGAGINIANVTAAPLIFANGSSGVLLTLNNGQSITIGQGALTQATFGDGTVATFAQLLSPQFTIGNTTYASGNTPLAPVSAQSTQAKASMRARDGGQTRTGKTIPFTTTTTPPQVLVLCGTANLQGMGNNVNDVISANAGNDTLIAGTANDTLIGGGGAETYVVGAGTGTVTTINSSTSADNLIFTGTVTLSNITVSTASAANGSLIVTLQNNQGGSVVINSSGGNILDQITFYDGSTASLGELLAQLSTGPTAATSAASVTLATGIQNMTLTGSASIAATGNAQDNVITANTGNDTLIAGTGADTLKGGGGIASYVFNQGDTNVTITNSGSADTLVFGAGITESDLTTSSAVVNGVTVVTIADNQGDEVIVQGGALNNVSFADGNTATITQLLGSSYIETPTLYSTVSATAGAGITAIDLTGSANISATANALNDIITANSGNDTLNAGTGNDTLIGNVGSNTYVIASGTQVTTIEQSSTLDTLSFGAGVSLANLSATAATVNGATVITLTNSLGGSVVIDASATGPLDQISFANGSTASLSAILAQATTGITAATSAANVTLAGGIQNMILTGSASITATGNGLDDVITSNTGNDTLIAGFASDTLVGGSGATTYEFNVGNTITITHSGSADKLVFGTGITESDLTTSSAVVNGVTVTTITDTEGGSVVIQGGGLTQVSFADGSSATLTQLLAPAYTVGTTTYSTVGTTAAVGIVNLDLTGSANIVGSANSGNDVVQANNANDTLIAGSGNDTLIGSAGITTYVVGTTSGVTTIQQAGTADILSFGAGIVAGNLAAVATQAADGSTTVTIADSAGNNVVIDDYVSGMLDTLSFTNGSTASLSVLLAHATSGSTAATSAVSVVLGAGIQNMILTGNANISATGNALTDIITANAGSDTLIAGSGSDTLVASFGNDTLSGGGGIATYQLSTSTTNTTTITQSSTTDTLLFGAGISVYNLTVTGVASANGVSQITINIGGGGTVVVDAGPNGQFVNQLQFADGTTASLSQLLANSTTGSTALSSAVSVVAPAGVENITLTGTANLSAIGNNLTDVIIANSGSDTLIAGSGHDTLIAGTGNDLLTGDIGNTTYQTSTSGTTTITQSVASDILLIPALTSGGAFNPITLQNLTATVSTGSGGEEVVTISDSRGGTTIIQAGANGQMLGTIEYYSGTYYTYGMSPTAIGLGQFLAQMTTGSTAMTSAVSVTPLPTGIQNLTLTGTANLTATGNNLNDVITANGGNDTLIAGSANDTLVSATGNVRTGNVTMVGGSAATTYLWNGGASMTINQSNVADILNLSNYTLAQLVGNTSTVNGQTVSTITYSGNTTPFVTINGGALSNISYSGGTISLAQLTSPEFIIGNTMYSQVSATLSGTSVSNLLLTGNANISASGNALSDTITSNYGNDTLISGTGGGTFNNSSGNGVGHTSFDTDVINAGDGNITINNSGTNDVLQFGAGITASDLTVSSNGVSTYGSDPSSSVTISDSQGGSVVINVGTNPVLNTIKFADGTSTTLSQLFAANPANVITMATGSTTTAGGVVNISTTGTGVTAYGNSLDDILTATGTNDTLYAGSGIDTLVAASGASGTTFVDSSYGTISTFVIDANSGTTSITYNVGDTLKFGPGITAANVSATTTGLGQWVLTTTQGATVNVTAYSTAQNLDITGITFADGSTTTFDQLLSAPVISGATETSQASATLAGGLTNLTLTGYTNITGTNNNANGTINGNAGNDTLIAGGNNDGINSGSGNDTLVLNGNNSFANAQGNNDVVTANGSNDTLNMDGPTGVIGVANMTLIGGTGNTTYTFSNSSSMTVNATIENSSSSDVLDLPSGLNPTLITASTSVVGGVTEDILSWGNGNVTIVGGGLQQLSWGYGSPLSYTVNQLLALGTPVKSAQTTVLGAGVTYFALTGFGVSATANNLNDFIALDPTYGYSGNDTLISGSGNDTLDGGITQEVFQINQGSGTTTIIQSYGDTLKFGAGITASQITATSSTVNGLQVVTLQIAGNNPVILDNPSIFSVTFADGTSTTIAALLALTAASISSSTSIVMPTGITHLTLTGSNSISGTGNNLADVITANSGNDTLIAGSGLATLIGGAGNDTFVINNTGDVITEGANIGNNTEQTSVSTTLATNVQNLTGTGTNALNLTGNNLSNLITANNGTDTLVAGSGLATLVGGIGNDTFVINNVGDVITEAANTGKNTEQTSVSTTLAVNVQNLTGTGTNALSLVGNNLNNVITANNAADTLTAGSGNDTLISGTGGDTLIGGAGNDTFYGKSGTATTYVVNAGNGNIVIDGSTINDVLEFGAGITVSSIVPSSTGTGSATVVTLTTSAGQTITINNPAFTQVSSASGTTTLQALLTQGISVSSGSTIVMPANASKLTLTGTSNISATGNNLADTIIANSGNDTLIAGNGVATLVGGSGNDTFVINNAADVITEAPNTGNNTELTSVSITATQYVQNLTATGSTNVVLNGFENPNLAADFVITANSGNDQLTGGSGASTLIAGTGNDTLIGQGNGTIGYVNISTTYQVNSGDGIVSINNSTTSDILQFGTGITAGNITASSAVAPTGDTIVTLNIAGGKSVVIDNPSFTEVSFANGTYTTLGALLAPGGTSTTSATSVVMAAGATSLTLTGANSITATGNASSDVITANSGNDTLIAGSGAALLIGGSGNDTFVVNNALDEIVKTPNTGNNTEMTSVSTIAAQNVQNLTGTGNTALSLWGYWGGTTQSNIVITANSGNDTLISGSGSSTLIGGAGNDTLYGDGNGTTNYVGPATAYVVNAGDGNISISYTTNNDVLEFGVGIAGSSVTASSSVASTGDTLVTLKIAGGNSVVIDNPALTQVTFADGSTDTLANLLAGIGPTNSTSVTSAVSIVMPTGATSLTLTGTNSISGTGNNLADTITANTGNDTLIAGSGLATLIGGSGNDTFVINNTSDVITEAANTGNNTEQTSVSTTLAANVQNLTGTGTGPLSLTGNTLANTITANSGADTLVAGSGNDTLISGSGVDSLTGGAGNDTFVVNNSGDTISVSAAKAGNITQSNVNYVLPANLLNLTGVGTNNLSLTGNASTDTITANSGADTLIAGSGLATLIGGSGNDTFIINNASDVITKTTNTGNNTEQTSVTATLAANVQNLTGTSTGNLTLTGNTLADTITANTGADTLISGTGIDTLVGGTGNDTFVVNNSSDAITVTTAKAGNVTQSSVSYVLPANLLNLTGTTGTAISLTGNTLADTITANTGADTLISGSGIDTLVGGTGNDTFMVNNSSDAITVTTAKAGNVVQSNVNYVLPTNLLNLTGVGTNSISLTGNASADTITANSGADTLIAGSGIATLIGGSGNDTFVINNASDVITKATNTGNNTEQTSVTATLAANVQKLTGTGSNALTLTGNTLNDVITGNTGTDKLVAGVGNDTLTAGSGIDTLTGGAGNDVFNVNNTADVVTATSGTNVNTINTSVSYTAATNVQDLFVTGTGTVTAIGNTGNDLIIGSTGANTLVGGSGVDVLEAGSGATTLKDTAAANALIGGAGNDTMTGGTGTSFIAGGAGNDAITLGAGTAVVAFNTGDGAATIVAGSGLSNVLSLGGGIAYANLTFSKSGNNLILKTGGNNAITFTNWYAGAANQNFVTMQVLEQSASTYSASSTNVLYNSDIEEFSFTQLVAAFNAALVATPTLTSWNLTNALLTDHLSSSNTAALGGDLAYYDGLNGNLTGMNLATAVSTLQNATYGKTAQTVDAWSGISTSNNKLH